MTKLLPGQGANSDPQARIAGRCLDGTDGDEDAPVECFLGHPWRSQRGHWMGRRQFLQAGISHPAPALRPRFGPRKNVWLLAVRSWGIFASVDRGRHWSLPIQIGGSSGSGLAANLLGNDGRADSGGQLHSRERPQRQGHGPVHSGEPKGAGVSGAAGPPSLTTSPERSIRGGPIHRQRRRQQHARESSQGEAQQG